MTPFLLLAISEIAFVLCVLEAITTWIYQVGLHAHQPTRWRIGLRLERPARNLFTELRRPSMMPRLRSPTWR
ncbi:hypothetical protein EDB81DRAFT_770640 [Dactylonectria macrodidyma]|uniref:Uncharacterized protein n=1 Tax=Dactylonectria macrodidyma TaxID=307937 RepID=A0A9P9JQV5_9HYPO|nr:hypothetical protein EDB81DRAFT_770640 [Dactylonectria macrodidyma]